MEEEKEFGDFEEIKDEKKQPNKNIQQETQQPQRIRSPRQGQLLGVVIQRLGGNRMEVKTTENKSLNCRVPGRFKRRFWLRPGDAVLVEPWPDNNDKADIVYQYSKNEMYQLRKRGILDSIKDGF